MSTTTLLSRLNLNLTRKGLLLVSVLLSIELLFIGTLSTLLMQAEHEIWLEAHANAILARINTLSQIFYESGSLIATYSYTKNPMFKERYELVVQQIPTEMHALALLYMDSSEDKEMVSELEASTNKVVSILERTRAIVDEHEKSLMFIRLADLISELKAAVGKTNPLLVRLADKQKQIEERMPDETAKSRLLVQNCLIVGVGLNIGLAVMMALSFVRGITARLGVLSDNTRRLSKHESLNPQLEGNDEIASLDHTFHDMARQLRESEQLKQDFLSMISHDLRSPLSTVQGSLVLMQEGAYGEPTDKMSQVINRMERNTIGMLNLINDLLDIEKFEAGMWEMSKEDVQLKDIIERAKDTVQFQAEQKNIELKVESGNAMIHADSDRLVRVLVNLLSNAIKFSPKESTITLSAKVEPEWVEVRVTDQGRGIPEDSLDKVFDRFQQVALEDSKLKGGSGLGLAICKAIVQAHDGTIGVESKSGEGASFWFRIPAKIKSSASA